MQFDADTVGSGSPAADAEMCMMAADTMEALGIPRGSYVVKVSNRKILDGALESIGLGGDVSAARRLTVLRAIDKLDRLGVEGVKALLGEGRKDESGDYTKGAQLDEDQIGVILGQVLSPAEEDAPELKGPTTITLTLWKDDPEAVPERSDKPVKSFPVHPTFIEGERELWEIGRLVTSAGYGRDRIRIDPSVVRGLEYYTGPVFEVELTFETKDEHGRPVRFGSVGGGGRYDGLVSRFRGEPVLATGFSIGVSRLQAALTHLGKLDAKPEPGPVVVTVFDKDRIADYQQMVKALRDQNIRAELYLGSGKMGPQFKYADKRGSPCVVIQGGDEKAKGEVQIKDLILGATLTATKDRDEYLKKQAEAQFAVREDKLVDGVRQVLARHNIDWA
jgi:histidyl-tRNA synthetase